MPHLNNKKEQDEVNWSFRFPFKEIVPISALKQTNLDLLDNLIMDLLPEGNTIYPEDQITDRPERFLVAEIVREKLTRRLGDELPYALTVEIEKYEEKPHITKIYALIWVERETQKNIVIGKQGELLKSIGMEARKDIEKELGGSFPAEELAGLESIIKAGVNKLIRWLKPEK